MLVYVEHINPRKKYAIETFYKLAEIQDLQLTDDTDFFKIFEGKKVNYSEKDLSNSFQIIPHSILSETGITEQEIKFQDWNDSKCFFKTGDGDFSFDIFAASFFLLTRYEEYFPHETDNHDRFMGKNAVMFKNGLLMRPLIDEWISIFCKILNIERKVEVKTILTIDVDNAFAFAHKPFFHSVGGAMRNVLKGGFSLVPDRIKTLQGKMKDPYDTYDDIIHLAKENSIELKFFFLLGDRGGFDTNLPHDNPGVSEKIKLISKKAECGIHPSYKSYLNEEQIKEEVFRLQDITGDKVKISRQHFLRLCLPESYRILISAGIKEDYTMGFADEPGYRAGTSRSFHWYDLENEIETELKVIPFVMMDGTLKRYLGLSPEKAIEYSKEIYSHLKKHGGQFIILWHNETVNDYWKWKGWRKVLLEQVAMR